MTLKAYKMLFSNYDVKCSLETNETLNYFVMVFHAFIKSSLGGKWQVFMTSGDEMVSFN